jgi:hypothetical protein
MEVDSQEVEAEFDGGWVKLHRQIQNERVFQDPYLLQLYCHLLFKSRHKAGAVSLPVAGHTTTAWLNVGQCIVGRNRLGEDLNCKPSTVWDRLKRLEGLGMITVESDNHKSVVSIINYQGSHYVEPVDVDKQVTASRQPSDKQVTASRQPGDTKKKGKKVKKDKNDTIERESIGTPTRQEIEEEYLSYIKNINEPIIQEETQKLKVVEEEIEKVNEELKKLHEEGTALPQGDDRKEKYNRYQSKQCDLQDLKDKKNKIERDIEFKAIKIPKRTMGSTIRNFENHFNRGLIKSSVWKDTLRSWVERDVKGNQPLQTYGQKMAQSMGLY